MDAAKSNLRFSVVIPTCRRNDLLARCLQQLADDRQDLPAACFEVIVSDDSPPDLCAREMIAHDFPAVRWIEGPRRGPAANRNHGAAQAHGEWLAFTDDDCVPDPGWLAAFVRRIDAGPQCNVLEGRTTDDNPENMGPFYFSPQNQKGGFLWSCNIAIERRFFEGLGGFDEKFPFPHLEDVDLRLRLEDAGHQYPFVPGAVVDHPPRQVVTALRWVQTRESAYYLARKRGEPVNRFGINASVYMRGCFHAFRQCRSLAEGMRMVGRIVAEMFFLAFYLPRWAMRYPDHDGRS